MDILDMPSILRYIAHKPFCSKPISRRHRPNATEQSGVKCLTAISISREKSLLQSCDLLITVGSLNLNFSFQTVNGFINLTKKQTL